MNTHQMICVENEYAAALNITSNKVAANREKPACLGILKGAAQELQGRCPTGLQEPEALHLDRFLSQRAPHCNLLIKLHNVPKDPEFHRKAFICAGQYVMAAGNKLSQTHNITERGSRESGSCFLSLTLSNMLMLTARLPENGSWMRRREENKKNSVILQQSSERLMAVGLLE